MNIGLWTGVDVDLTRRRVAGVDELVRHARGNDNDSAYFDLALFISDRDGDAAFDGECDFGGRMFVRRRALSAFGVHDVNREGRHLLLAFNNANLI
jgi:hypothetical protein